MDVGFRVFFPAFFGSLYLKLYTEICRVSIWQALCIGKPANEPFKVTT